MQKHEAYFSNIWGGWRLPLLGLSLMLLLGALMLFRKPNPNYVPPAQEEEVRDSTGRR
ncbi:MAG: hypothetical protein HUU01_14830 [Saprospiraceae bacterium]|nr:hypothetical protein [Saprospiraceae bacterium]